MLRCFRFAFELLVVGWFGFVFARVRYGLVFPVVFLVLIAVLIVVCGVLIVYLVIWFVFICGFVACVRLPCELVLEWYFKMCLRGRFVVCVVLLCRLGLCCLLVGVLLVLGLDFVRSVIGCVCWWLRFVQFVICGLCLMVVCLDYCVVSCFCCWGWSW